MLERAPKKTLRQSPPCDTPRVMAADDQWGSPRHSCEKFRINEDRLRGAADASGTAL